MKEITSREEALEFLLRWNKGKIRRVCRQPNKIHLYFWKTKDGSRAQGDLFVREVPHQSKTIDDLQEL